MKTFRKYSYIIYFVILYIILIAFDYVNNNDFNWFENLIQSIFYVFFLMFFNWALNDKDNKNEKKTRTFKIQK
jgi:hypothetical protein